MRRMMETKFHKGDRVRIVDGVIRRPGVERRIDGFTGTVEGLFPDGFNITLDFNQETYYLEDPTLEATGEPPITRSPSAAAAVEEPEDDAPVPAFTRRAKRDPAQARSDRANKAWATRRAKMAAASQRLDDLVEKSGA